MWKMKVYAKDESTRPPRYYELSLTRKQAEKFDNGALISTGLTAPRDISSAWVQKHGKEVSETQWRHSSCQTSCVTRGDVRCRW